MRRCRSTRTCGSTPTSPATQTDGRDGDNLSYRGLFDYIGDKYGLQAERLVVEPNFLPEIGFVRRTDMRRNFGAGALQPAADDACRTVRRLTTQASLNYLTNNAGPARHARSDRRASRPSSPTATCSASSTPTASSGWSGRSRSRPA